MGVLKKDLQIELEKLVSYKESKQVVQKVLRTSNLLNKTTDTRPATANPRAGLVMKFSIAKSHF